MEQILREEAEMEKRKKEDNVDVSSVPTDDESEEIGKGFLLEYECSGSVSTCFFAKWGTWVNIFTATLILLITTKRFFIWLRVFRS